MSDKQPIYIMPENVNRTIGKDAQRNNILAAKVVADIVKTTLGPKGMDKMLVDASGNIIVTNDGVTILEEMEMDHPAAKMLVEIAKTQESEVGDGTTTAAVLAGKLLENSEKLLDKKIHPTVIVKGYKIASDKAIEILNEISKEVDSREILEQIAKTAMTGKVAEGNKENLSRIIVDAVEIVSEGRKIDSDNIKIVKIKGEDAKSSHLVEGVILEKERASQEMPSSINNANILLVDFPIEIKGPETETKISINSPEQLEGFLQSEERRLKEITTKIIESGANVILCQKGIDDIAQYYFARKNIFAVRRLPKSDMEMVAKATSAKIISNLADVNKDILGKAERVEEIKNQEGSLIYIIGCQNPKAVSISIRGGTNHVIDEVERAVKDGLGDVIAAIKSGKIVAGGGAVEVELARRLRAFSKTIGGREQLAIEEFASSLESLPETLAENAGLDPIEILTELKKRHEAGDINHGLNLFNNTIEDTFEAGIIEPIKVKTQAISSASEVAGMILRIDDVLISKGSGSSAPKGNPYQEMD